MSQKPAQDVNRNDNAIAAARRSIPICAYADGALMSCDDEVAVERVLEIHVAGAPPLMTMRTPGNDLALAAGLLHGEGVITGRDDIVYLRHAPHEPDVVRVMLRPAARERLARMQRATVMNSACGVCGKPSFRPPRTPRPARTRRPLSLTPELLLTLPQKLYAGQGVFSATGGIHAAGLFDARGTLLDAREDVGRHNALDKLIGQALQRGQLPLRRHILLLSSRASYELLQKSIMAGIGAVCALSAPSSYAVELALDHDVTLIGFLRGDRFNVYSGKQRIAAAAGGESEEKVRR